MHAFFDTLRQGLSTFFSWLPHLIGAAIILVIAWFIGKLVGGIVRRVLTRIGINKLVEKGSGAEFKQRYWPSLNIAGVIGKVVFWFIFLIGLLLALDALQVATLTQMITAIVAYIPDVVVAILIIIGALFIATVIRAIVTKTAGRTFFGRALAAAAPAIVIAIGVFLALTQLRIATQIVVSTYIIILASVGLGLALAFGLGGRGVAQRVLEESYEKGRQDALATKAQEEAMAAAEAPKIGVSSPAVPAPPSTPPAPPEQPAP